MDPYTFTILSLAIFGWMIIGIITLDDLWVSADTWGWKAFIALITGPAAWGVLLYRWINHVADQLIEVLDLRCD